MSAFATNAGEKFANRALEIFFEDAVTPLITNNDYEGEIKTGGADRLNILTLDEDEGIQDYTGGDLTLADATESEAQLIVNQQKAYYFRIKSVDAFESYVSDPANMIIKRKGGELQEVVDGFVLGLHGDVAAGNRAGTSYTTGTVGVTATTGAVAGTSTVFTAAMVGKGFKADGHTVWYRVKTFTSTTAIVIEDDLDDVTSAYTGGTISTSATYEVQANTPIVVTASNVYAQIVSLRKFLNKSKTPKSDRWLVVNADVEAILLQSDDFTRATESDTEVIRNGLIGRIAGMTIYSNEEIDGDNTNGYNILAGHMSAITFAMAFTETGIEDLLGNFGQAYKGLIKYGAKVPDERRKALAELFCTV